MLRFFAFAYMLFLHNTYIPAVLQFIFIIDHCQWNDWIIGNCSKSCGGGIRTNKRTETVLEGHEGAQCDSVTSIEEECNAQECPG